MDEAKRLLLRALDALHEMDGPNIVDYDDLEILEAEILEFIEIND